MNKISLFDHRFKYKSCKTNFNLETIVQVYCSCGKTLSSNKEFFNHQVEELNKQLKNLKIDVEVI